MATKPILIEALISVRKDRVTINMSCGEWGRLQKIVEGHDRLVEALGKAGKAMDDIDGTLELWLDIRALLKEVEGD